MIETKKMSTVQVMRAIAALMVVFSHVQKEITGNIQNPGRDFLNIHVAGQAGVDMFFVISGFIMIYVTKNSAGGWEEAKKFLIRRVVRIVPIYWVLTAVTILLSIVAASQKNFNDLSPDYLIGSFLFIPIARFDGHFTPALGVGWTLNYEIYFYILFFFSLFAPAQIRIFLLSAIFVAIAAAGLFIDVSTPQIWFWSRQIILEFMFGAIIATLMLSNFRLSAITAVPLCLAGIIWWLVASNVSADPTDYPVRFLCWGVPSVMVFASLVLVEASVLDKIPGRLHSLLVLIGDSSFSLYLSHMFIVRLITKLIPDNLLGVIAYTGVFFAVTIPATILVAYGLYRLIEIPSNNYGRKIFKV